MSYTTIGQKERQLLLKDLGARLNDKVKVDGGVHGICTLIGLKGHVGYLNSHGFEITLGWPIPYLRPMSSMTEEEKKEYHDTLKLTALVDYPTIKSFDWLNAHHFDYRTITDEDGKEKTMIELGLALEAPKDMYV